MLGFYSAFVFENYSQIHELFLHSCFCWCFQCQTKAKIGLLPGSWMFPYNSEHCLLGFDNFFCFRSCTGHLYNLHHKQGDDGKTSGRKHWQFISKDLHDKLGVRVSDSSLKANRSAVVGWSKSEGAKVVDFKVVRIFCQSLPATFVEVCLVAFVLGCLF